jgi:hypothetical protein
VSKKVLLLPLAKNTGSRQSSTIEFRGMSTMQRNALNARIANMPDHQRPTPTWDGIAIA